MKLSFALIFFTVIHAMAGSVYSQDTRLSLSMKDATVQKVLDEIENKSEFYFLYSNKLIDADRKLDVQVKNKRISYILNEIFEDSDIDYLVMDKHIILSTQAVLYPGQEKVQLQRAVTGKVTDVSGEALPGVNIIEKISGIGTITDIEGNYTINIPGGNAILVFSFVGMETQEIIVGEQTSIDVVLESALETLDEVVITALGIKREEKTLTYSSQTIKSDALDEAKETNVINSLSGKIAGVQISRSATGPGGSSRVLIRGNRSISGNNQPLYIVDGIPIDNGTNIPRGDDRQTTEPQGEQGGISRGDGISNISTDDIESINVLKGASAAALYGSRAANGVIIITTKSGKGKKGIGIDINSSVTFDTPVFLTDFQNEYGQGAGGIYLRDSYLNWGPALDGSQVAHWSNDPADAGNTYAFTAHPDNYKNFFQTGMNLSTSVGIRMGNDKTQSYISYTDTYGEGIVPTNKLKRRSFNVRITSDITSKLSLDTKVNYINQTVENRPVVGEDFASITRQVFRMPRNVSNQDAKDHYFYIDNNQNTRHNLWENQPNGEENPYWILYKTTRTEKRDRILGFASLKYRFTDALSLQVRYGIDKYYDKNEFLWANDTYVIAPEGRFLLEDNKVSETNADFLLSYNKNVNDLSLSFNFGGNLLQQENLFQQINSNKLRLQNLFITTNMVNPIVTHFPYKKQIQSLYGFAQLGYKNFLFLDITARNDWSSTLPIDNNSFFYPSAGLTWLVSEMFELPDYFSFAKVRASMAQVGNSADPFLIEQLYSTGGAGTNRDAVLPLKDLKPEITTSYEIGTDLRFFDNRLGLDFTYYNTTSKNQLLTVPLASPSGWDAKYINAGKVNNKGIELVLSASPVKSDNISWEMQVNFAKNTNEVVELTETLKSYTLNQSYMVSVKVEEGKPYGELYVKGLERNVNGEIVVGTNGLPLLTAGQSLRVGNFNPDWAGGITNTITYKNVSLSFLVDIRQGGKVASFTNANLYGDGLHEGTLAGRSGSLIIDGVNESGQANNVPIEAETYWTYVGGRNTPVGELFTYDASNARLRELTLGYVLPSSLIGDTFIKGVKLSFVGRNLFFLYNKAGDFDPDQTIGTANAQGVEAFSLPTTRTYGFNVKLSF